MGEHLGPVHHTASAFGLRDKEIGCGCGGVYLGVDRGRPCIAGHLRMSLPCRSHSRIYRTDAEQIDRLYHRIAIHIGARTRTGDCDFRTDHNRHRVCACCLGLDFLCMASESEIGIERKTCGGVIGYLVGLPRIWVPFYLWGDGQCWCH